MSRWASRRRIRTKYLLTDEDLQAFMTRLERIGDIVTVQRVEDVITNDPPDNLVPACAVEGKIQDKRPNVHWSPRVPLPKIRRLYERDAQGVPDEELPGVKGCSRLRKEQLIPIIERVDSARFKAWTWEYDSND